MNRTHKYSSLNKFILLVLLLIAAIIVFLDVIWWYHNFESGLGTAIAQAAIAYHVIVLLVMTAVGIGLGHHTDQMIRKRKSIFRSPQKGSWVEVFMNMWGYELEEEQAPTSDLQPGQAGSVLIEPFVLLDLPTRRGRKPTFPLERWIPIALKWENRDPIRDAFTLGELIAEHLGINSDGSPIVSEQTYYSVWRRRAIDEIRRRAESKLSGNVRERALNHTADRQGGKSQAA
jgi:hypothetical protein